METPFPKHDRCVNYMYRPACKGTYHTNTYFILTVSFTRVSLSNYLQHNICRQDVDKRY